MFAYPPNRLVQCQETRSGWALERVKGAPVRRYQYTAIDDATRVRALKIYKRHTQANAINFIDFIDYIDYIDYVVKQFRREKVPVSNPNPPL